MNYVQMERFLSQPLIGDLATLRSDGSPHVAPLWYEFRDGRFLMFTSSEFQRVRNLEVDARSAISIATHDEPYAYVVAEGQISISTDGLADVARSIVSRYKSGEDAESFLRRVISDRFVVLEMTPERVITWVSDDE
jgi:PPOX class probable F420-dependent enzyme